MYTKLNQAKALFRRAGISIAVGTSVFTLLFFQDVGMAILVGIAAALTIGIILTLMASIFLRFPTSNIWITVIHFLLLPLIGLVLTGLAFIPAQLAPKGSWLPVTAPPEGALKFLPSAYSNILGSTVYIQGKSGNSYAYDCVSTRVCKWIEAAPILASDNQWTNGDCPPEMRRYPFIMPLVPNDSIDLYQLQDCGIDVYRQTNYVLLKDGKILTWTRTESTWNPLAGVSAFALIGLISGIITGFATLNLRKRLSNVTPGDDPAAKTIRVSQ